MGERKLIFKGGTCLRKCYFPDYRFSEDLDFTLTDNAFIINEKTINEILNEITQGTGIMFSDPGIEKILFRNTHLGYSILIRYWGADHRRDHLPPVDRARWMTAIKIEMTWYENVVFPVTPRKIMHDFSDIQLIKYEYIPCYDIHEIMAEKLRALIQRSYPAPRDYYDLWYISKNVPHLNWDLISEAFVIKARFKSVSFDKLNDFFREERMMRSARAWRGSLGNHLSDVNLPPFKLVIDELFEILSLNFRIS